jgi:Cu/Ag efflux protein CusF
MKAALAACDTNINRSADLKDLFAALAKAQGEMGAAGKGTENPYFKSRYADLAEIVRTSRPHLTKHGLCVLQQILPNDDNGQTTLYTILGHVSGQYIESRMRLLPAKADVQSLGSYITYIRRFSYAALIGVVVSDEDDDGETEVAEERSLMAKGPASVKSIDVKTKGYETITREQLDELEIAFKTIPDFVEDVLKGYKLQNLADMPKNKYPAAIDRIRFVAMERSGVK